MEQESICSPKTPKSQEPEENTHTHTTCQGEHLVHATRERFRLKIYGSKNTRDNLSKLASGYGEELRQQQSIFSKISITYLDKSEIVWHFSSLFDMSIQSTRVQEIQESFQKSCSDWFLNTTNNKHPGYLN